LRPDLSGHIVTAMVRQCARARRAGRRSNVPPGVSRYPQTAADLRLRIPGGEREPGAGLPSMQGPLPSDPASTRTPGPAPAKGGQLTGASADARAKLVHKSAVGLLRPGWVLQSAAGSGRGPAGSEGRYRPDGLACRPAFRASTGPGKPTSRRSCRSCGPRCSSGAGRRRAGSRGVSQRGAAAGEQHRGQHGLHARAVFSPRPSEAAYSQRPEYTASSLSPRIRPVPDVDASANSADISAGDSQIHSPAAEAWDGLLLPNAACPCPAAAGQIRKTCGVPAYRRVVIESIGHRHHER
jgi:hypothetical protein